MLLTTPTGNIGAVLLWFVLVGAVVCVSLKLLSDFLSLKWSKVRVTIYTAAALGLIGLSSLDQLTVLDVATVLILVGLAQLAYQLRAKGE